jgi:hypothetical protein
VQLQPAAAGAEVAAAFRSMLTPAPVPALSQPAAPRAQRQLAGDGVPAHQQRRRRVRPGQGASPAALTLRPEPRRRPAHPPRLIAAVSLGHAGPAARAAVCRARCCQPGPQAATCAPALLNVQPLCARLSSAALGSCAAVAAGCCPPRRGASPSRLADGACSQGGSTKNKLARVSGARLELHERDLRLDISGSSVAVRPAPAPLSAALSRPPPASASAPRSTWGLCWRSAWAR